MMKRHISLLALALLVITALNLPRAYAAPPPFESWLPAFKAEAISSGINAELVERAFSGKTPDPEIIKLDQKQPEFTQTFNAYSTKRVSRDRIEKGREMYIKHYDELLRASDHYGVAPQYITALWGMETNYGGYTGKKDIVRSLMTLAWNGRDGTSPKRAAYFRKELINVLKIIQQGHFSLEEMRGSWAGAFGQVQFMPSSFLNLAVDGDGDGRIDIRENLPDAFFSAANYLSKNKWITDQRWGREVKVPAGFNASLINEKKSLSSWHQLGLTTKYSSPIPVEPGMQATFLAPDGLSGRNFLVYNNFNTIKRWNNSNSFALSVGLLADSIAASAPRLTD